MKVPSILLAAIFGIVILVSAASNEGAAGGKQLFERRCAGCHALDNDKTGPRLRGVYGRAAASLPTFPYSDPLRKSGIHWDNVTLDKFLTDPDIFVPDTDMAFRVANPNERAAIIEYLKDVSSK